MKQWSDWIDNDRVGRNAAPDLVGKTVRIENADRSISTGKAENFVWTNIPRYQIQVDSKPGPKA